MSTGRTIDTVYYDVSYDGDLLYVSQEFGSSSRELLLIEPDGSPDGAREVLPFRWEKPAMSPDGTRIVGVPVDSSHRDLEAFTVGRELTPTRLTWGGDVRAPIWTPEGGRVTFSDRRHGNYDLFWMAARGNASPDLLYDGEYDAAPESWSPDGQLLAFTESNPESGEDIWLLSPGGEPLPFLRTEFFESGATFSPDGDWIAYHSNESGTWEVYLRRVPEDLDNHDPSLAGYRLRVTPDCGGWPVWSPDGTELYYRKCTGDPFFAVSIDTTSDEPVVGEPRFLFEGRFRHVRRGPSYTAAPDGRFLVVSTDTRAARLEIVLNWAEELKRLVPTER